MALAKLPPTDSASKLLAEESFYNSHPFTYHEHGRFARSELMAVGQAALTLGSLVLVFVFL
jgi:hypothetical protein